jgi:hypothetical protein
MSKIQKRSNSEYVLCSETLPTARMKASKLMRHQKTNHNETVTKRFEFFRRKRDQTKQQKRECVKVTERSPAVLKASIVIVFHTAKSMKPHTETKKLFLRLL